MLKKLLIFALILFLNSCNKKDQNVYETNTNINPYTSYTEGLEAFEKNQYFFANKKFSEAEINFEIPELAAKSAIMSSFFIWN